jgi:heme/copper-type cytochrome/quinol oxidase subunit 2
LFNDIIKKGGVILLIKYFYMGFNFLWETTPSKGGSSKGDDFNALPIFIVMMVAIALLAVFGLTFIIVKYRRDVKRENDKDALKNEQEDQIRQELLNEMKEANNDK